MLHQEALHPVTRMLQHKKCSQSILKQKDSKTGKNIWEVEQYPKPEPGACVLERSSQSLVMPSASAQACGGQSSLSQCRQPPPNLVATLEACQVPDTWRCSGSLEPNCLYLTLRCDCAGEVCLSEAWRACVQKVSTIEPWELAPWVLAPWVYSLIGQRGNSCP